MTKAVTDQNYEEYWKLTLEYSDPHGTGFRGTLGFILDFIDEHGASSLDQYAELQEQVNAAFPKVDMASTRKAINQFVKLGFVEPGLRGYHPDAQEFMRARTDEERQTLFSKILYERASFSSSVDHEAAGLEIGFVIRTLERKGSLTREEVSSLMTVDTALVPPGFLTPEELEQLVAEVKASGFLERKHNQVSYLWGVLGRLDDLAVREGVLYFANDARVTVDEAPRTGRDSYRQRIYKNQLKAESETVFGEVTCMVENLPYPALIASHIKPYRDSSEEEAFDPDNGLLLSRNMDALFDAGKISFADDGSMLVSAELGPALQKHLSGYRLRKELLNEGRKGYLAQHRHAHFDRTRS